MNEPFIGGDLDAISQSGLKLSSTGNEVATCGERINTASSELNDDIIGAMTRVTGTFDTVSGELLASIAAGKAQLEGTTWGGNSAAVATEVELELNTAVSQLDQQARERLAAEQLAFQERASLIMAEVGGEYMRISGEINERYMALGQATAATAANFAEADQTMQLT